MCDSRVTQDVTEMAIDVGLWIRSVRMSSSATGYLRTLPFVLYGVTMTAMLTVPKENLGISWDSL